MKIYPIEKELGLSKAMAEAKATAKITLPIRLKKPQDVEKQYAKCLESIDSSTDSKVVELIKKAEAQTAKANASHPLMMYGSAILVSTVMNLNDDVFLPAYVWEARHTPVNTPYNDQHIQQDIIGHIYSCKAVDEDLKEIPDDSNPPEFFHLVADFVLYEFIYPEIAQEVSEGAENGEKFVSMECMFSDFDYGLFDEEGKAARIIERNEKTAFLTQHLRSYGGTGDFGNYRVGRVLKQINFVGMGNVDVPANPDSEYLAINDFSFASADNLINEIDLETVMYNNNERPDDSVGDSFYHVNKGKAMKIETLEQAQEVIAELERKISESENAQKVAEIQAQLDAVTEEKEALSTAHEELKTQKQEADEALEAAKTELETTQTEYSELKTKIEEAEATEAARKRLSQLREAGVEVEDEEKELEELRKLDDETFASILAYAGRIPAKSEVEEEEESNDTPSEEEAAAAAEASDQLDDAEEEEEIDPALASASEEDEDPVKAIAARLAACVLKRNKKEESK